MVNKFPISHILLLIVLMTMATGCGTMTTKGQEFPLMYEESPRSILILPPMNESTAAEAKEYYSTTVQEPLTYAGYYVFPYEVTAEILKMEGLYDAELLRDMPLAKFREYFGADAVLFTTIKKWDLSYIVLSSKLTVSIDCELKSTKSDQTLWKYNGTVVVDLSSGSGGSGLIGLAVSAVATAVKTAVADYVPHARTANVKAINSLPYGHYHPKHHVDQSQQIADQTPQPDS